jgi:hypothetical protein
MRPHLSGRSAAAYFFSIDSHATCGTIGKLGAFRGPFCLSGYILVPYSDL